MARYVAILPIILLNSNLDASYLFGLFSSSAFSSFNKITQTLELIIFGVSLRHIRFILSLLSLN